MIPDMPRLPMQQLTTSWLILLTLAFAHLRASAAEQKAAPSSADASSTIHCIETDDVLELRHGEQPILRYHKSIVQPPEGVSPLYARSGHLHPVWTPAGRVVTSEFPADHLHQHGVFSAWVKTTFEGRSVDFWNQKGGTGTVEHVRVLDRVPRGENAGFTVELRHLDLSAPGGPKPVLREIWQVTATAQQGAFLFDIESRQTCIADSPLLIHEYHYGGMAFRGADAWLNTSDTASGFRFETSEGLDRIDGNHTRPRWVAARGPIDGSPCTLAIAGKPGNFRHPQPVRLHPSKPYFVFSSCVLGEFQLNPGVEHVNSYRYVVADGTLSPEQIDSLLNLGSPATRDSADD